jgi:hypothetical protein
VMEREEGDQLAKMINGSSSTVKSRIACAVLYAESGNHTPPACGVTFWGVRVRVRGSRVQRVLGF